MTVRKSCITDSKDKVYMADGVIEEMGSPEEVFENPKSEKTRAFLRGTEY